MTSLPNTLVHPLFNNYKFELRHEAPGPGKNERLLCDACGTGVDGWYYHCDRNMKRLDLHPCCAELPIEINQEVLERANLPMEINQEGLTFELRKKATRRCNICGARGGEWTFWYYRSTCRTVYLHVRCVKEKLVTYLSEPGGSGGSTSTTPAANTTTMTALQGYSRIRPILEVVARVILPYFVSRDQLEIITAAAGLISNYSTGR